MTLSCNVSRSDLLEGLNSLQNITNKRVTLAILSNVLIQTTNNSLVLTATDLEVGLRIEVPAEIIDQGELTLPSKKIFEIVRESGSEDIQIKETENSWVIISAGLSTYNLAGMASDEYPEFPTSKEDTYTSFEAGIFSDIIDKVIFSIANEEENAYSLTNVLFETEKREGRSFVKMISSDGHRLSIMEKDVSCDVDLLGLSSGTLIPKKGIQELKKFCESRDTIELSFENKQLFVRENDSILVLSLKEGEFPKYGAIVDAVQLENKITMERIPFLDSLKRINLFTEDVFHTIQIEIDNGKMILSSQNIDLGNAKDIQDVKYDGEALLLGFNCRYFIDALQAMECENVDAYINSNNSPCLMKSELDEGFLSIIMPMQL
jgi:DNA polymerase-3 subunit beta